MYHAYKNSNNKLMTVTTTTIKNSYSGNGSTTAFAYTFPINSTSEITVIERSATGAETVKSEGSGSTNYSISDNGASGGTITMVTAPASGTTLVIRRNTALTQETDYVANDPFPAETHEDALDKLNMQTQELQEELDRSFKVSRTNTITTSEFTESATDRASKALGFDSDGNLTTIADFLPAGGDNAQLTYSTTTTDSDPGAGKIRFNNSSLGSATAAYVDDEDANGTDISAWVQSFDDVTGNATNRGRLRVTKSNSLAVWHTFKISGAITDASGYTKLALTYIDGAGSLADADKVFISFVPSGEDGAIPGYYYKFATSTTDSDPGGGYLRFNNGTYASATAIYIDDADANGATTQTDTITWDDSTSTIKGYLHIIDINDSSTYARFSITGSSTDASGYNKLAVTHLASNNTFSADDELSVHFTRQGDKGDTGSTGSTGNSGVSGIAMTWSSSTSDADPGAGKIAFNHATLSSVSVLYVDDADDASADITSWVQSWDDATNTVAKGFVKIEKEGAASTYALYKVNGAITDASGYTKVPVAHVVSAGSFSNTDGVGVSFTQSGTDGSMTSFTVAGSSGSSQTITNGNTLTIAAGANITTTGSSTDTVTIACTLDDPVAMAIAMS